MSALIVDAGPLYAALDRGDIWHTRSVRLLETHPGPLVVPSLVIAEVSHLASKRLGLGPAADMRLAQGFAEGLLTADPIEPGDWMRIAELVVKYADFPLGVVDASVIACAERHGVTEVATVDRRHFGAVRPRHVPAFTLLP